MTAGKWLSSVVFSLLVAGCGGGQSQQAKSAVDEQRQDNEAYRQRQPERVAKQAGDEAEMARKHAEDRAELGAAGALGSGDAARAMENAQASVQRDRREFLAEVKARLDQLDNRVNEVRLKASRANAKVRDGVTSEMRDFSRERDAALQQLNALSSVSPADWDAAKSGLNAKVNELERTIDRTEGRL